MHEHRLSGWRRRQNEHKCSSSRKAIQGVTGASGFGFERTKREHEVVQSSSTKCAIELLFDDFHGTIGDLPIVTKFSS
jgi:hypothetical protein